ncbi:MAG: hypothetical protein ACI9OJ_004356 [Myxococcota bacterium]|jgi:hypothetical protein
MTKQQLMNLFAILSAAGHLGACSQTHDEPVPIVERWAVVAQVEDAALLGIHGTSPTDVWAVGADDGTGPVVLRFDGSSWTRIETGVRGDLWWVQAFDDGTVFFAGADALTLRYADGVFTRMANPGLGKFILFGLWGSSPTDLYAVGTAAGRNGFIWHSNGESWTEVPLPADIVQNSQKDTPSLTKVWGSASDDVWVVGGSGTVLRGNAASGFTVVPTGIDSLLFTVHGANDRVVVVGGSGNGVAFEADDAKLISTLPDDAPFLQGVCVDAQGVAWATGGFGAIFRNDSEQWVEVDHGLNLDVESLHAVWADASGGIWSVGGNVVTQRLDRGVVVHNRTIPTITITPEPTVAPSCPTDAIDLTPDRSIARRWNEQLLNAIRRDTPRPTVHGRNLFHTSLAIWDAYAAYDEMLDGVIVQEHQSADDIEAARQEAISYAAYRILSSRYQTAIGGEVTQSCLDGLMAVLEYNPSVTSTDGNSPSALGNRVGERILAQYADDGSNEANDYADPDNWTPSQPRLTVDSPGTPSTDPTQWQQLILAQATTQNGIDEGAGTRGYIGAHWRDVTPFAMTRPTPGAPYHDMGTAPTALDEALVASTVQVIERTSWLDVADTPLMDISPSAIGDNPLGTDDGQGRVENPTTGQPYAQVMVKRGDFGRVLSEFWADGPESETPPGHWNTLANYVADHAATTRQLFGQGPSLDPLAWDVHMYLALNGAVHDAAIAAWELKRIYTSARPITLIRHMGGLGQRSDPTGPAYHPEGLPLQAGLIEVITEDSVLAGERHAHLARYVGEIALYSWRGEPGDRDNAVGGVGWIRAKNWIPYQRRTFVTPAFPGYISGHSTFSRAAAEVLTQLTGSPLFPGGLGTYRFEPGYLFFEAGPSEPVELQWATYFDASDQAGQSRLWGGIHVISDDLDGRRIGSEIGLTAVTLARTYFDGSAVPDK